MRRSTRFFRHVWRINGVLILLAAVGVVLAVGSFVVTELGAKVGRMRDANDKIALAGSEPEAALRLGDASPVEGTSIIRAELQQSSDAGRFSSGYSTETRNILFIEPGQKAARWLLADNAHVVADTQDIKDSKTNEKHVIATAVLVNPPPDEPAEVVGGRLLLFDPAGRIVIEVSKNVHKLHVASVSESEVTLLFERNHRFVLAAFDPKSLAKVREQEIEVPRIAK